MVREELGISIDDIGSPYKAALSSFALFSIGAIIPIIPFFFGNSNLHIFAGALLCALGLFALGALVTFLTGKNVTKSGLRQMVLGLGVASVTFMIGWSIDQIFLN